MCVCGEFAVGTVSLRECAVGNMCVCGICSGKYVYVGNLQCEMSVRNLQCEMCVCEEFAV